MKNKIIGIIVLFVFYVVSIAAAGNHAQTENGLPSDPDELDALLVKALKQLEDNTIAIRNNATAIAGIHQDITGIKRSMLTSGSLVPLSNRITALETSEKSLQLSFETLNEEITDFSSDLATATEKNTEFATQIATLETSVATNAEKITALEETIPSIPDTGEVSQNMLIVEKTVDVPFEKFMCNRKKCFSPVFPVDATVDGAIFFIETDSGERRYNLQVLVKTNGDDRNELWYYKQHFSRIRNNLRREEGLRIKKTNCFVRWYTLKYKTEESE